MIRNQFFNVLRRFNGQIVRKPDAIDFLMPGQGAGSAIEFNQRRMVCIQIRANARDKHRRVCGMRLQSFHPCKQAIHIGLWGRPKSEIWPVKLVKYADVLRFSRIMESSERLWMMRPSCSVFEQKVQPPKQPEHDIWPNVESFQKPAHWRCHIPCGAGANTADQKRHPFLWLSAVLPVDLSRFAWNRVAESTGGHYPIGFTVHNAWCMGIQYRIVFYRIHKPANE